MKQYINNKHMSFNIKDFAKRYLTGFILGACLFSIVGSYTAVTFASNEVTYNNSSSGLNATNVKYLPSMNFINCVNNRGV